MANRRGKCETILDFLFLGSKITANGDSSHEIRRWLLLGRKVITPIKCVVKQRYQTAYKGPCSQNYGLPSGLVRLWELDEKEGRVPNNWCLWTVLLRKNSESPLDTEEIKPVSLKEIIWTLILTGRKDAKTSVFWSLDVNSELIGKLSDAGRDWGQKEKGTTEDEMMVGWHHWFNGHEFEQTLGDSEGQGILVCYSPRGHKESDTSEQLNNDPFPTKVNDQLERAFIVVQSLSHVWLSQTQMTTHQNILLFLSNYESQICESVSMLLLPGSFPWMSYPGLKDSSLESSGISVVAFITVYHI